ncbi:hypothetical protein [Palleronia sp. LCG004]|uniref:peptidoglycan-binding domain-containing protein n=1 Tax=Palleronia sp. LCG004 TaxID=3079304 RepID=UPI002942063C|nr:hypothetical protein [Palleronia sp. LCG004]WOI57432.1 hypothetical protein RVY76_06515 [Palleronia sp. LCG004]
MKGLAYFSAGLALAATGAGAEPCVGASYDTPLPGAVEVERMYADVPSPTYPGLWQEGRVAGYVYRIFSNLSATLSDRGENPDWAIDLRCGGDPLACTRNAIGAVPERAEPVADEIAACLRGESVNSAILSQPSGTMDGLPLASLPANGAPMESGAGLATAAALAMGEPAPVVRAPSSTPGEPDRPSAQNELPTTPPGEEVGGEATRPDARLGVSLQPADECGLDGVPREGTPILVLQRLLDNAGHEIGAIDGLMGPRTRLALDAELGPGSAEMEIEAAITALDAALCNRE